MPHFDQPKPDIRDQGRMRLREGLEFFDKFRGKPAEFVNRCFSMAVRIIPHQVLKKVRYEWWQGTTPGVAGKK